MFTDNIEIYVRAGKGGDGRTSFLHEKYRAMGGPDGGDGGNGGSVIFEASHNLNTLSYFRGHKRVVAEDGRMGGKNKAHGKSADDVVIMVPVGTMVFDGKGQRADLTNDGQTAVIARGGQGGFGNAHFTSSTRQAPRASELGEPGEELELRIELKLVADVGLIGLPNAGKSTLLSVISNARPQIADYPFTTLVPNLGVADIDDASLVVADIPGLIEGASAGKGLGDEFLRHIERTAVLIHLIDCHSEDLKADYRTIQNELKAYDQKLARKPQLVVLTKTEGRDPAEIKRAVSSLKRSTRRLVMSISAQAHIGLEEMLRQTLALVQEHRDQPEAKNPEPFVYNLDNVAIAPDRWQVERHGDIWIIHGQRVERFAGRTDFNNPEGEERFRDILRKLGVTKRLDQAGLVPGDTIEVAGKQFRW